MRSFLLASSLLLVMVISLTACSESEKYCCRYDIGDICAYHSNNPAYLEFELDKDEVLNGKISVGEFGTVVFFYSDPDPLNTFEAALDPVRVEPWQEYTFSIKAKQPTRLLRWFHYTTWSVSADFYCNIPPVETWVARSDDPFWTEPTMIPVK